MDENYGSNHAAAKMAEVLEYFRIPTEDRGAWKRIYAARANTSLMWTHGVVL